MEKENYYLLLDLSIDPPENDKNVIQKAIKKKQTQWSRYRNHPTKAIQAKRYIGLIPEIRKVMGDPELRKNEAKMARLILQKRDQEKFAKLDRHLSIVMGKDGPDQKVIGKLVALHTGLGAEKVRDRIAKKTTLIKIEREIEALLSKGDITDKKAAGLAKSYKAAPAKIEELAGRIKKQRFAEIDKYLSIRIRRGYITQKAIAGLAKLYSVGDDEINRRVKCPVRKESGRKKDKPKPLDRTIEKLINDNLRIVKKSSLYAFLDIAPSASLEKLQERAKQKDNEVRSISQKDAMATASAVLAGHCIAIFRTDQTRNSYELTRMLANISEFEAEIDISEIDGKIKPHSLNMLVRSAVQIGMDPDEAFDYIEDYAKVRKWDIGSTPRKRKFRMMVAAAVFSAILLVIGAVFGVKYFMERQERNEFNELMTSIERMRDPDKKEALIKKYLKGKKKGDFTARAEKKLVEVREEIVQADYRKTVAATKKLVAAGNLEKAVGKYKAYIGKHPRSEYTGQFKEDIDRLSAEIDERDHAALNAVADKGYDEKIEAYHGYLEKHPDGKYKAEVGSLISETINAHFKILKKDLTDCEAKKEWEKCITLAGTYIEKYKDHEYASELKKMRAAFENHLKHQSDLDELGSKAEEKGMDYIAAIKVYEEYLQANPESSSYMRKRIAKAVGVLMEKHKQYLNEEKEWNQTLEYCQNVQVKIASRIAKMRGYVERNPAGRHTDDAKTVLEDLTNEKAKIDREFRAMQEEKQWAYIYANYKNGKINISERIRTVEKFLASFPADKYSRDATVVLQTLKKEKAVLDERRRLERAQLARINAETAKMKRLLRSTGRRFVENGNGTIRDTKSGLMWTTVDSSVVTGACMTYYQAADYVKKLTTGGYNDWRLPTANELHGIYKTKPFFPSDKITKYWSGDVVLRGWNKHVHVVSTVKESAWNKEEFGLEKCAHVRAAR